MSHHAFSRSERIADQIARSLGKIVRTNKFDSRLNMVTVTHVDLSSDMRNAKVYYLPIDEDQDIEAIDLAFKQHVSEFRYALAHDLAMKYVPKIQFMYDAQQRHSEHLSDLINKTSSGDESEDSEDQNGEDQHG